MNFRSIKIDKLPTIRRLPAYLNILRDLFVKGEQYVSSSYLAEKMFVEPILVRKDLELTRVAGTPRVGYSIEELITSIEEFLGCSDNLDAVLVGVGQFGASLLGNRGLRNFGLRVLAAFDEDSHKARTLAHRVPFFEIDRLEELLQRLHVTIAILCVPSEDAQKITDILVASGIRGIWNFTSENLAVPEHVVTQKEDLASGLAVLCAKLVRNRPTHH
ncbi:MAG TPA: redox-sensing transcriptional repressor Rex [Geobacteraceae bacterium]|nr:redox-sensing transcriptional repressor Rex [Geobacteraceae bacterium]